MSNNFDFNIPSLDDLLADMGISRSASQKSEPNENEIAKSWNLLDDNYTSMRETSDTESMSDVLGRWAYAAGFKDVDKYDKPATPAKSDVQSIPTTTPVPNVNTEITNNALSRLEELLAESNAIASGHNLPSRQPAQSAASPSPTATSMGVRQSESTRPPSSGDLYHSNTSLYEFESSINDRLRNIGAQINQPQQQSKPKQGPAKPYESEAAPPSIPVSNPQQQPLSQPPTAPPQAQAMPQQQTAVPMPAAQSTSQSAHPQAYSAQFPEQYTDDATIEIRDIQKVRVVQETSSQYNAPTVAPVNSEEKSPKPQKAPKPPKQPKVKKARKPLTKKARTIIIASVIASVLVIATSITAVVFFNSNNGSHNAAQNAANNNNGDSLILNQANLVFQNGAGYTIFIKENATISKISFDSNMRSGSWEIHDTQISRPTGGDILATGSFSNQNNAQFSPRQVRTLIILFKDTPRNVTINITNVHVE